MQFVYAVIFMISDYDIIWGCQLLLSEMVVLYPSCLQ